MSELKTHPWLSSVDWESLLHKQIRPPLLPNLRVSNFDSEYTSELIDRSEYETGVFYQPPIGDPFYGYNTGPRTVPNLGKLEDNHSRSCQPEAPVEPAKIDSPRTPSEVPSEHFRGARAVHKVKTLSVVEKRNPAERQLHWAALEEGTIPDFQSVIGVKGEEHAPTRARETQVKW